MDENPNDRMDWEPFPDFMDNENELEALIREMMELLIQGKSSFTDFV